MFVLIFRLTDIFNTGVAILKAIQHTLSCCKSWYYDVDDAAVVLICRVENDEHALLFLVDSFVSFLLCSNYR